ncbi:MAG: hypothetical protein HZA46_13055 [Planctomycetales bacterium]|nr:hypothetical protein [Planctomycetales bacterium]
MRIVSKDGQSWLTIIHHGDDKYSAYEMEAHVNTGLSQFHAKNFDVHLLCLGEFIKELDRFISDRSLCPQLDGTYDSFVRFRAVGTAAIVEFCIGDNREMFSFRQSGVFEMDQEYFTQCLTDFRRLNEAQPVAESNCN